MLCIFCKFPLKNIGILDLHYVVCNNYMWYLGQDGTVFFRYLGQEATVKTVKKSAFPSVPAEPTQKNSSFPAKITNKNWFVLTQLPYKNCSVLAEKPQKYFPRLSLEEWPYISRLNCKDYYINYILRLQITVWIIPCIIIFIVNSPLSWFSIILSFVVFGFFVK